MKKITCILFVLIPAFLFGQISSQQHEADSLKRLLDKSKKDSERIKILENLGHHYAASDPSKGLDFAVEANALAKELKLPDKEASSLAVMAINYDAMMDFDKAIEYNQKASALYLKHKNYLGYAAVYANLSSIYMSMGKYANALSSSMAALAVYDTSGTPRNKAIVLENIGSIYFELKKYTASEMYYKGALLLFDSLNNKSDIARCSGNLARIYTELNATEQALRLLFKAYRMNAELHNQRGKIINLTNIGIAYLRMKKYDSAYTFFNHSLNLSKKLNLIQFIAFNKGNIGTVFLHQYKFTAIDNKTELLNKAIDNLQNASNLCDSLGLSAPKLEFDETLLEAFTLKRDYEQALSKYRSIVSLKDTLHSIETRTTIAKLETQRELELKDKDILIKQHELEIEKLSDQKRTVIYLLVILLLSFLIFLFARYHISRINARKKEVLELKQIHAHQVRGPVATIIGLADLLKVIGSDNKYTSDELIQGIETEAKKLDKIVTLLIKKED
ncbi:MAG: tetratricopeptide repeat protein [Bacteroidia bacterium]|jgi:tetratricopeptide (TPR) repeat protein